MTGDIGDASLFPTRTAGAPSSSAASASCEPRNRRHDYSRQRCRTHRRQRRGADLGIEESSQKTPRSAVCRLLRVPTTVTPIPPPVIPGLSPAMAKKKTTKPKAASKKQAKEAVDGTSTVPLSSDNGFTSAPAFASDRPMPLSQHSPTSRDLPLRRLSSLSRHSPPRKHPPLLKTLCQATVRGKPEALTMDFRHFSMCMTP